MAISAASNLTLSRRSSGLWRRACVFIPRRDILLKYLSPEIHVTRIGLNENWRRGVKVIFRQ